MPRDGFWGSLAKFLAGMATVRQLLREIDDVPSLPPSARDPC